MGPDGLTDQDTETLEQGAAGSLLLAPSDGLGVTVDSGDASSRTATLTAATLTATDTTSAPL